VKFSFIIVYSNTKGMATFDPKSWPSRNYELEEKIIKQTNKLITQIQSIPIEKEILLMDQTNDFDRDGSMQDLQIIPTYQYYLENNLMDNFNIDLYIGDNYEKKSIKNTDQNQATAIAYNHGVSLAIGDYLVIQHNDTQYSFKEHDFSTLFYEFIEYMEENDLQYLTIDKKPIKNREYPEWNDKIEYYADCYWFFCKSDFYKKNKIWVDWKRGDNNHLSTIFCINNNLKFEHLPGYYENTKAELGYWWKRLVKNENQLLTHIFKEKIFLYHYKGGTGMESMMHKGEFNEI
jgi:hypothetical protein